MAKVKVTGPLFQHNTAKVVTGAVFVGILDLAEEADDIMASHIARAGFVDSGELLRSVAIRPVRSSDVVTGYALVSPTATWKGTLAIRQTGTRAKMSYVGPNRAPRVRTIKQWDIRASSSLNRPTFEWLRRGVRNQRKLRPGYDFIGRTATVVRGLDVNGIVGKQVAGALNG